MPRPVEMRIRYARQPVGSVHGVKAKRACFSPPREPMDGATDAVDQAVVRRIAGLTGVFRIEVLGAGDRESLQARRTPDAAENRGVAEVLAREHIVCLFKDGSFRPP